MELRCESAADATHRTPWTVRLGWLATFRHGFNNGVRRVGKVFTSRGSSALRGDPPGRKTVGVYLGGRGGGAVPPTCVQGKSV